MNENLIHIEAFDCLPFDNSKVTSDVLCEFIQSQSKKIFKISSNSNLEEEFKLAEYDYRNNLWIAGRFVGEAIFTFEQTNYKITIKPRFGERMLFRMLEAIFNIRITKSASETSKNVEWLHYIKRILAFIWLQKLAMANSHGIPKMKKTREHKGEVIRGRLDIRRSIKSLYNSNEVISTSHEKQINTTIAQIIFQAYLILKDEYEIGKLNLPDSAKEAIIQILSVVQNKVPISENDYKSIQYKEIYLGWKPIVDLSWEIINRKQKSLKQNKASNGFGFFIDMAEVWEQYLRSILKKNLLPIGWQLKNEKQIAYKGYFWQRELIPDLVFQKDNQIAIWDAKYKRMLGRPFDVDRSDFFQIHTYIQYQLNKKVVKTGGLLYPISSSPKFESYISPYLLNENGFKIKFSIDGIELKENEEMVNIKNYELEFINRIISSLNHLQDN